MGSSVRAYCLRSRICADTPGLEKKSEVLGEYRPPVSGQSVQNRLEKFQGILDVLLDSEDRAAHAS